MNNKKGISLIVLVITILVMIILAGVVIVSLQNDNPINRAKFAKMVDSVQSVRGAISQYAVTAQAGSANQTGNVDLTQKVGSDPALLTGTTLKGNSAYKDYYELNTTNAKSILGVDPTTISGGKFYVDKTSGASVFVLTDTAYDEFIGTGIDGFVKSADAK